jgi:hypothetical protein
MLVFFASISAGVSALWGPYMEELIRQFLKCLKIHQMSDADVYG